MKFWRGFPLWAARLLACWSVRFQAGLSAELILQTFYPQMTRTSQHGLQLVLWYLRLEEHFNPDIQISPLMRINIFPREIGVIYLNKQFLVTLAYLIFPKQTDKISKCSISWVRGLRFGIDCLRFCFQLPCVCQSLAGLGARPEKISHYGWLSCISTPFVSSLQI